MNRPYPVAYYQRKAKLHRHDPASISDDFDRVNKSFHFDLIHAHQIYPQGYIAVCLGKKYNIPVVITARVSLPRTPYQNRWWHRRKLFWTLKKADAVTAVSRALAKEIRLFTKNRIKVHVIYNGVQIPDGSLIPDCVPNNLKDLQNKHFILTLGRLRKVKGIDILLNGLSLLKKQGYDIPHLVIAGDGSERQHLQKQAIYNGLEDNVTFVGQVTGQAKSWLLANCGFLAQPSRSEGLGISVLEALSYGKAVLAANVGGLPELISNEENGLLFEPDNIKSLANGLKKMQDGDLLRFSCFAKKAACKYSWERITQQYLEIFESLLH